MCVPTTQEDLKQTVLEKSFLSTAIFTLPLQKYLEQGKLLSTFIAKLREGSILDCQYFWE